MAKQSWISKTPERNQIKDTGKPPRIQIDTSDDKKDQLRGSDSKSKFTTKE